ncbi:unnamed protein product [Musa acuminata var. zebrina]
MGKKEPEQWRSALLLPARSEKGEERVSAPPPFPCFSSGKRGSVADSFQRRRGCDQRDRGRSALSRSKTFFLYSSEKRGPGKYWGRSDLETEKKNGNREGEFLFFAERNGTEGNFCSSFLSAVGSNGKAEIEPFSPTLLGETEFLTGGAVA